jgi:hypothetical protein
LILGKIKGEEKGDGHVYCCFLTGSATDAITNVNTSDDRDFRNLPSGWSTISGGSLNLVTSFQVDDMGRDTEETNPNGNVTYWVYNDEYNEVPEYSGWEKAVVINQ